MNGSPTVLVSLAGVAPGSITPERMPHLAGLLRAGGGFFAAPSALPPSTGDVHESMVRGVPPQTDRPGDAAGGRDHLNPPSVLRAAHWAGRSTLAAGDPNLIDELIEPRAATHRLLIESGHGPLDDHHVVDVVEALVATQRPDVMWIHLGWIDPADHDDDRGRDRGVAAMATVDAKLGRLARAVGDDASVVVVVGRSGVARGHGGETHDALDPFVTVRSPRVTAGSTWAEATVLDIAPTLADLAGFEADARWQGRSLLGRERPMVDHLLDLLRESGRHHYGESVTMLEHVLQSAAEVAGDDGDDDDDELILAALLHDIGHVVRPGAGGEFGAAGIHGRPDHAEIGAAYLRPWLPATVVEPIRLHVAAKRHLVGTDPEYADQLSDASRITLEQQGGAFSDGESARFLSSPHADRALRLRRCDDLGKRPELAVASLDDHRERIADALARAPLDPMWVRDACRCRDCRDGVSDQHLIDPSELAGWTVLGSRHGERGLEVDLVRSDGTTHTAQIATRPSPPVSLEQRWSVDFAPTPRRADETVTIASDVARHGLALVHGIPVIGGAVLQFASSLGFVRETNYGAMFDVRVEPAPINLAYSSLGLALHTDNPYREPAPSVQVLHCLVPAASGGANRLADGFAAAARLRREDPPAFGLLSTTIVRFRFHDDEVDLVAERPVIECGVDGSIRSIAVNYRSLDTPSSSSFGTALSSYVSMLDGMAIEISLDAGQAIVFDNRRILHARTAFDATAGRHLQGCYIDVDSLHSIARLAARR